MLTTFSFKYLSSLRSKQTSVHLIKTWKKQRLICSSSLFFSTSSLKRGRIHLSFHLEHILLDSQQKSMYSWWVPYWSSFLLLPNPTQPHTFLKAHYNGWKNTLWCYQLLKMPGCLNSYSCLWMYTLLLWQGVQNRGVFFPRCPFTAWLPVAGYVVFKNTTPLPSCSWLEQYSQYLKGREMSFHKSYHFFFLSSSLQNIMSTVFYNS